MIILYFINNNICVNSLDEFVTRNSDKDILQFLLKDYSNTDSDIDIKVFYSLDWAVASLMNWLHVAEAQLRQFWNTGHLYHRGYKFFYVPHRYLSISYGRYWGESTFSDLYQYNPDLKYDIDADRACSDGIKLAEEIYSSFNKISNELKFKHKIQTISSPVAIFQKNILNYLNLPTWKDLPFQVNEYSYRSLCGGWQECFQKGHYNTLYDYDITSAYSKHTADLIDTRTGNWINTQVFVTDFIGIYRVIVDIESDFSPVIYKLNDISYTPKGQFECYLYSNIISQINEYKLGEVKILNGWYWKPDRPKNLNRPLASYINKLFELKQKYRNTDREIVKRMMVGIWGKFTEIYPNNELGRFFNPFWAGYIESSTRHQVAEFILLNKAFDNLLSITVDGCTLDKHIALPDNNDIGTWRLNIISAGYIITSGISTIKGKKNKGLFTLDYDWLNEQIENNPTSNTYTMRAYTPVTLGYALAHNKLDSLGELELKERSVIIDYEYKRNFDELPSCGIDLRNNKYKSSALDISQIILKNFTENNTKTY